MLDINTIKNLFCALNEELRAQKEIGEVGLCGGAVMCLVFNARTSTKDVDAIFEPAEKIRKASRKIAHDFNIDENWLNDAAKGFFLSHPPENNVLNYSHLRVWAPTAEYMLAMKCVSARFDSHDKDDVSFLIQHLQLTTCKEVFKIIAMYYPRDRIPAKTKFLVEELFDQK